MNAFVEHFGGRVPTVVVGVSSLDRLRDRSRRFDAPRGVLVVDSAVVDSGYTDRVRDALDDLEVVHVHVAPPHEPTAESVDATAGEVRAVRSHSAPPVVVGVGGGTALDTAKLGAAVAAAEHSVEHYALGAHRMPAGGPVVAIPTTAGTGAEVTRTCVLTDRTGRKVWTWDDELLPDLVVLDPAATATMPNHVTIASGLDALVHAIEAVTGQRRNALVAAPGLHAIRLVLEHLPAAVRDGSDLDVRQSMQEAALLAGVAIDGGGTGIAHSIGHALGTLTRLPHGVAVAVGLAAALAWNVEGDHDAFEPIATTVGRSVSELEDAYATLLRDIGFPSVVARHGELSISPGELAAMMVAPENLPMYENNCRPVGDADRHLLAERALQTWDDLLMMR